MILLSDLIEHMQQFDFDELPCNQWQQLVQEGARRFIKQHELDLCEDQVIFYYLETTGWN